jgi:hypothetical protein
VLDSLECEALPWIDDKISKTGRCESAIAFLRKGVDFINHGNIKIID